MTLIGNGLQPRRIRRLSSPLAISVGSNYQPFGSVSISRGEACRNP